MSRRRRRRSRSVGRAGRVSSPNFRHFPGDDGPTRSFVIVHAPGPVSTKVAAGRRSASPAGDSDNPSEPDSLSFHTVTISSTPLESSRRHPPNFDQVTGDVFSSSATNLELYPHLPRPQRAVTVSLSDTSIVHLVPRNSSCSARSRGTPSLSGSANSQSEYVSDPHLTGHSSSSSSQYTRSTPSSIHESVPSSHEGSLSSLLQSSASTCSGSSARGTGWSCGSSGGCNADEEPLVTFRFEHQEDADGNHVVIGREGKLSRCEDEPIRTPGAVQGFGVLIVVQEDAEGDNLLVRQVSENSTELLGLSPTYLFSLDCFTDVLPDSQAGILWDKVQYLADPDEDSPREDDSPHVFLLNGWGMPGSALLDDGKDDPHRRRSWSCWCAAHRPKITAGSTGGGNQDLIILEFELEHDVFNPLYPARPGRNIFGFSGLSSSGSYGTESTSSTGTSGTLVSNTASPQDTDSESIKTDSAATLGPSSPTESALMPLSVSSLTVQATLPGPEGDDNWTPSAEDILESTTNYAKPLPALERIRKLSQVVQPFSGPEYGVGSLTEAMNSSGSDSSARTRRNQRRGKSGTVGMMDIFAVMSQVNEQLGASTDMETFLKIVVGIVKDLTQFHRVLVYQFDEHWNGQTVAELVDWSRTHDLYRGLHFPASDIPAQARHLYTVNKLRLLYDREQTTARLIVKSKDDIDVPLNMTHCYLRAMSPIHIKYLANMDVRSSMSVSIVAFGQLWGLVACHSYGLNGMRVSFPVRQMLRLMSDSISRNIERLSYAQRLLTHKLFNRVTGGGSQQPYIISNADDLLGLFDADFGVLVIGEGAKILGPNEHGQEVLIVAEYLRLKRFGTIQVSQAVTKDFPDLRLTTGLEIVAGLLYVPLSQGGADFIALLRKGQPCDVRWAGKPYKDGGDGHCASLEPRASFKVWSETVAGRCRVWTDEQLETAGVLALVYGKFIEVWREREREKERSLQTTKLKNILLSNAGHEVRTPLNHIINCLELALNSKLDIETRDNLSKSHAASKSLLFTINDLLDLTRVESGHETTFNEPFDLPSVITEATNLYKCEAQRKGLHFEIDLSCDLHMVIGDSSKVRTVVANLTANALKYTQNGAITVSCREFNEPEGLRNSKQVAIEISVGDTGCGIPANKLESIFREFEQVESAQPKTSTAPGLGLGLAVVARSIEQLGGQLRVDSQVDQGSRFSFLIPFTLWDENGPDLVGQKGHQNPDVHVEQERELPDSRAISPLSRNGEVSAISIAPDSQLVPPPQKTMEGMDSENPKPYSRSPSRRKKKATHTDNREGTTSPSRSSGRGSGVKLRILSVEDNDINRLILAKRLQLVGHTVINTTNGKEGVEMIEVDQAFDCVLMDVQMPILDGFEATQRIRNLEATGLPKTDRLAHLLNGGRIPIFAVSASLVERQRGELEKIGIDGWLPKPIDFGRLYTILRGVTDPVQRSRDEYRVGGSWEIGGWLLRPSPPPQSMPAIAQSISRDGVDPLEAENSDRRWTDTDTLHHDDG